MLTSPSTLEQSSAAFDPNSLIVSTAQNIPDAFFKMAERYPKQVVFKQAQLAQEEQLHHSLGQYPRTWRSQNYLEVQSAVAKLCAHLYSSGVKPQERVAILCGTRPEWMYADLAIMSCAAVSVSVYPSLVAAEIAFILHDSESRVVIAENEEQVNKLLQIQGQQWEIPAIEDRPATVVSIPIRQIIAIEEVPTHPLVVQLSSIFQNQAPPRDFPGSLYSSIATDDLACLVYTSGTTGPPKGVKQTHGNHLANVRQSFQSELVRDDSTISLILPLAHSFAKLMAYIAFLSPPQLLFPAVIKGDSAKLIPQSALSDIRQGSATVNPFVPRLLEKIRDSVVTRSRGSGLAARLLRITIWAAQRKLAAGRSHSDFATTRLTDLAFRLTKPIRRKLRRSLFGPTFGFCLSGGAKLPVSVAEFFNSLEIPLIEGYGLTETVVATNVGRIKHNKIGTVGPVLAPDIEMRLDTDGEILFRGPNVSSGYYRRPRATAESWDAQGWFHTGDLGTIDADGYLSITGRKKEIIVTSGGKKIAPHDIEVRIKSHPLVSQAVLIGDGRKYCVALVSLEIPEAKRLEPKTAEAELYRSKELHDAIWQHVLQVNAELASFAAVKRIFIVPEEFSPENGQMTPTLKLKRGVIEKRYLQEIAELY